MYIIRTPLLLPLMRVCAACTAPAPDHQGVYTRARAQEVINNRSDTIAVGRDLWPVKLMPTP